MISFPIEPAGTKPLWILLPLVAIVGGVLVLMGVSVLSSRTAVFEVAPGALRLRGDFYGRTLATTDLALENARRIDPATDAALSPSVRTMGTGLPGYRAGWFRLRNGEKALVYLTDWNRAVYIPTRLGYALLLSPRDPDGFLQALRAR